MAHTNVQMLYGSVVEDVICNIRELVIDEGLDEHVLLELKSIWEKKIADSKALEQDPAPIANKTGNKAASSRQRVQQHVKSSLMQPTGNLIPPAMFQYATHSASGEQKSAVVLNIPSKLAFTIPAQLAQASLHALTSTTTNVSVQQVPGVQYSHGATGGNLQTIRVVQLDGNDDSSDDDGSFLTDDDDDENDIEEGVEDDPLNSGDDVSDEDGAELFDSENVVVCQFDKITRSKNKWKFHLKDGIMNLKGKDYVFQKALGDSEW